MKRVILTCVEDNVTGELGLIVDGLKQLSNEFMATTEGLIIAHDLIEHQNGIKAIGSIDDELEALGACWWIRGQWGLLREGSYNSPEEGLARDVGHLGEIFCRGVEFRTYVPRTRPGEWNETIEQIVIDGVKNCRDEIDYNDEMSQEEKARLILYSGQAINFMRKGIIKAKKRFDNKSMIANNIFWNIARAVDPYAKHCEIEGQQFELIYSKNGAFCDEYYPDDY